MNSYLNQMEVITNNIHINPLHIILAYVGMLIHVLVKLQELKQQNSFVLTEYIKKNIYSFIASLIMIPVILILSSDTSLKDFLPINNLTAVLAGCQTQSIFKSLMLFAEKKTSKNE
jgi:hypothetical protein